MKFMVLMYADPATTAAMTPTERAEVFARHEALHQDLQATGEMLNGAGLAFPTDTTTLRWQPDAAPTATDGPFAKATEHVTAYYVVECENAERAKELATRVLDFHVVAVEVRPIHDWFGMGAAPAAGAAAEA
ncbi:YciI family protein [Catenulispora rubra]|uniref:YciI family protein n=1 Tax=Catenulispora rubra TaxID=280293 RepID=UPI00189284DC|nr:YciI family protein [Catenulispora rubra]